MNLVIKNFHIYCRYTAEVIPGGNYLRQARILSDKYHVILPTLDGHGEEYPKRVYFN